jgi:hypothetical protein
MVKAKEKGAAKSVFPWDGIRHRPVAPINCIYEPAERTGISEERKL